MKKYSVVQYWFKGTSVTIKFQSNSYLNAVAALSVFKAENPENNYTILQTMD